MSGLLAWAQGLPAGPLYLFIFAWLFVESTGFPISDEPLLLLAGYLAHTRRLDLPAVVGVALVGKVGASCVAFWLGRHIQLERLARPAERPTQGVGRLLYALRPTTGTVQTVEQRFRRQGVWGVFLGRLVPVVRSFISYPAGAARMPTGRFLVATTAGSLIWIGIWTLLGAALGKSYETALARWGRLSWLVLAVFLLALGALWLWSHRRATRAVDGRDREQIRTPMSS
jgi:alkaline phosphatase